MASFPVTSTGILSYLSQMMPLSMERNISSSFSDGSGGRFVTGPYLSVKKQTSTKSIVTATFEAICRAKTTSRRFWLSSYPFRLGASSTKLSLLFQVPKPRPLLAQNPPPNEGYTIRKQIISHSRTHKDVERHIIQLTVVELPPALKVPKTKSGCSLRHKMQQLMANRKLV